MFGKKKQPPVPTAEERAAEQAKTFFDSVSPGVVKFMTDYYIVGDKWCCAWAIREYPVTTDEPAILSRLGDRTGVTLRIYHRLVDIVERNAIMQQSTRKNTMMSMGNDVSAAIEAQGNLEDLDALMRKIHHTGESMFHVAVFIELSAESHDALRELQHDVSMELTRGKITVDRLTLRQKEGFLSVQPYGSNQFGAQYERVLPVSSTANLFPLNYSGKSDPHGFYIGRDKFGSSVLVDFDRRSDDKTNSNVVILGNSGQGKSYLLKTILTNLRESGKDLVILDPEAEYEELTEALGGTYVDFMSGQYIINPLEPKSFFSEDKKKVQDKRRGRLNAKPTDDDMEENRHVTRLSQHISFLKDFFRTYKNFTDMQIDTIESVLLKLYAKFHITDETDFDKLHPRDYPTMRDFYDLLEEEFIRLDDERKSGKTGETVHYTAELVNEVCLALQSMCIGAESKFFNGHSNIRDEQFVCFGVKGLLETNKRLKDTMLFNILSYMSHQLLGKGNTVAAIDEAYLFLSNLTAIEYIRNAMKRVRKKDSAVIIASQNVEDFMVESVKEFTMPMLSIPDFRFFFYLGKISPQLAVEVLRMEPSEHDLISNSCRGQCLFICGNERHLLMVRAPEHKAALFGKAGGR